MEEFNAKINKEKMKYVYLILFVTVFFSCQPNNKHKISNSGWFEKGDWKQGWTVSPDKTLDKVEFKRQFEKNPDRWRKAFHFLATTNLDSIEVGKYEIDGKNLTASVLSYTTREEDSTQYESHRKYADLQYVVHGKEYIGVMPLKKMEKITVSYNKEKDIAHYYSSKNNYRLADSTRFFIFFPNDAHRTSFKVKKKGDVKRIILKVALD